MDETMHYRKCLISLEQSAKEMTFLGDLNCLKDDLETYIKWADLTITGKSVNGRLVRKWPLEVEKILKEKVQKIRDDFYKLGDDLDIIFKGEEYE